MERLSTGLRINSASDDAAGLAIAARMGSQVRAQVARNANDGISWSRLQGAYVEVSNMLSRMKEMAVQVASVPRSTDRAAQNLEFSQLRSELLRIAGYTQWNGFNIRTAVLVGLVFWNFRSERLLSDHDRRLQHSL